MLKGAGYQAIVLQGVFFTVKKHPILYRRAIMINIFNRVNVFEIHSGTEEAKLLDNINDI